MDEEPDGYFDDDENDFLGDFDGVPEYRKSWEAFDSAPGLPWDEDFADDPYDPLESSDHDGFVWMHSSWYASDDWLCIEQVLGEMQGPAVSDIERVNQEFLNDRIRMSSRRLGWHDRRRNGPRRSSNKRHWTTQPPRDESIHDDRLNPRHDSWKLHRTMRWRREPIVPLDKGTLRHIIPDLLTGASIWEAWERYSTIQLELHKEEQR